MNPAFTIKQRRQFIALALAAGWLYTFSLLYQLFFTNTDNPQKAIARIEQHLHRQEADFERLCADTAGMLQLFNKSEDLNRLEQLAKKSYSLLVYHHSDDSTFNLRFWNNRYALPDSAQLYADNGSYAVQRANGQFELIKKSLVVNDTRIILIAFIPIRWDYFIENDYLKKEFAAPGHIGKRFDISQQPQIYSVKNRSGQIMLYLQEKNFERNTGYSNLVLIFRTLSIVLMVLLLFNYSAAWCARKNFSTGFLVLCAGLLLLLAAQQWLRFPFDQNRLELFDPSIYASGKLFSSLGALVVVSLFVFMVVMFVLRHRQQLIEEYAPVLTKKPMVTGVAALVVFTIGSIYTSWLIRSLIADSTIPFDVTNFFSLNIYSLVGFITLSIIVITYFQLSTLLLHTACRLIKAPVYKYAVIALTGLVTLYLGFGFASDPISIFVVLWCLLLLTLFRFMAPHRFSNFFSETIVWLIFFSSSVCLLFNYENSSKEMEQRRLFAKKLALYSDPETASLLRIALIPFDNLFLWRNFSQFNSPDAQAYKNRLINSNFSGFLKKFDTRIFTYDASELPLANPDTTPYQAFKAGTLHQAEALTLEADSIAKRRALDRVALAARSSPNALLYADSTRLITEVPAIQHLYFVENKVNPADFQYVYLREVVDTARQLLGYFVINIRPLAFKSRSVASSTQPELFRERSDNLYEKANNYVFAVYKNLAMRGDRFMDYDLPVTIKTADIPLQSDTIKKRRGYQELWYKINNNSVVVVGKKNDLILATITLFAYLFFSFILVWLLSAFIEKLLGGGITRTWLRQQFQFTIRKQVQGILLFASLVSFMVIGIAMITLFKNRFERNNQQRLAHSMSILRGDVQNLLEENNMFEDEVNILDGDYVNPQNAETRFNRMSEKVNKISEVHSVDFNIYDTEGRLTLSSLPLIASRGVVSNRIDPVAFYHLREKQSAQYTQSEKIGDCPFTSMYVPVFAGNSKRPTVYLNIPYYKSGTDLKQEISNFLLTIINLNAFIFLVAGLIAWLVTNRITRSFLLIGEKMKAVNLGRNEMINWNRNDEIGGLVIEYNKMVRKLEASAAVLAKSEREGAWREMARQVAHEIKNPLTPMKLSIQYLQRSIANGSDNVQELTASVSRTLVEQIDHLSNIAADFSQFANIIVAKRERFKLYDLLQSLQLLFSAEEQATVTVQNDFPDLAINADKTHINRLFTNLIQNALQSYQPGAERRVHVQVQALNGHVTTAVADFGMGIPEDRQDKIFTPNFTTKTSGTGLGLAISKGIVEQAHGEIWFETALDKGTTFFVKLPVAEG